MWRRNKGGSGSGEGDERDIIDPESSGGFADLDGDAEEIVLRAGLDLNLKRHPLETADGVGDTVRLANGSVI